MVLRTPEQRADLLTQMAVEFNATMPVDVYLKGDGSVWVVWVKRHGNDTGARKATQEEVIKIIFAAIDYSQRAISV